MNKPLQPLKLLDREQSAGLRSVLFRHLDGFPIVPTMIALQQHGVLALFESRQTVNLATIVEHTGGNEGYLQVAMRLLCSQGWLVQNVNSRADTVKYTSTNRTRHAFQLANVYKEIAAFLPIAARIDDYLYGDLADPSPVAWGMQLGHGPPFVIGWNFHESSPHKREGVSHESMGDAAPA